LASHTAPPIFCPPLPMPSLYNEILINASRHKIWRILSDKDNWMYWNTYLYDCSFRIPFRQGQEVLLAVRRVPGDDPIEFAAKVTIEQPPFCLSWTASIPGFRNKTVFELQDRGPDQTQLIHQENFTGLFSKFAVGFIRQDQQRGMRRMAIELKQFAEKA
jgi:hypothetical protein